MRREGISKLYRGILPPLLQRTSARCIMFGTYNHYCRLLGCHDNHRCTIWATTAAFLAGCTEAFLCPFERVQTILQSPNYHGQFKNAFDVFWKLRKYGLAEYYRGWSAILLRNGFSNALFFASRDPLKELVTSRLGLYVEKEEVNISNDLVHLVGDFASGSFLGATISTLFFPLNMLKTRSQARSVVTVSRNCTMACTQITPGQ
uniref:Uncharacterized protein n=1 Tax=Trichuris muris TaxID=70415 RepID=A0A5S6QX66_TRIMR